MTTSSFTSSPLTENAVFPTPWRVRFELHPDDSKQSYVAINDFSNYQFATYEGNCEGAGRFIDSAHVMQQSHRLLEAAKGVVACWEAGDLANAVRSLARVIADAERA